MIGIVFCGLSDKKLKDKIVPLCRSKRFSRIYIIRDRIGPSLPDVFYFTVPRFLKKIFLLSFIFKLAMGIRVASENENSLIISYNAIPYGVLGLLTATFTKRKHMLCLIGTDIHYWLIKSKLSFIVRIISHRSAITITTGTYTKAVLESQGLKRIYVILNTIDINDYYPNRAIERKKKSLVFIGGLSPVKRVDRVLQLINNVSEAGYQIRCSIFGEGKEELKLKKITRSLGIDNRVIFHGHRPDIHKILSNYLALCVFSEYEGFPAVIAEALCSGVFVIARTIGDIADISDSERKMLIINEEWDLEYFTQKVIDLLERESILDIQEDIEYFRSIFSYENGGRMWRKAIERL